MGYCPGDSLVAFIIPKMEHAIFCSSGMRPHDCASPGVRVCLLMRQNGSEIKHCPCIPLGSTSRGPKKAHEIAELGGLQIGFELSVGRMPTAPCTHGIFRPSGMQPHDCASSVFVSAC